MYYHPLAFVKSGHVKHAGELAEVALDSWTKRQQRCIEAMEEIWTERLRALPALWGSRDPYTFAIDCPRRSKIDPPCRPNIDPGMDADQMLIGCG